MKAVTTGLIPPRGREAASQPKKAYAVKLPGDALELVRSHGAFVNAARATRSR